MKSKRKLFSYFFYDFVMITAALPGLLFFRIKKIYVSKKAKQKIKKGALLISNHTTNIDPIVLMFAIWYRRHHFIATKELFDRPFKKFLFTNFHCIEIDRENMSVSSFSKIVSHLKDDKLVSMFPEGHITLTEEVQKFKSGVVLMAYQSKKPIIPVYVKKRKSFFNRQVVIIGEAINVCDLMSKIPTLKEINKVTDILREKESQLKEISDSLDRRKK